MHTKIFSEKDLDEPAELLRRGELIAFPTETVFGLGACLSNEEAVRKIFCVKGRPSDNPLIVHLANPVDMEPLIKKTSPFLPPLVEAFCPGPITFLLPKSIYVPDFVSAGLPSVAIRMPSHPTAQALLRLVGEPVVAPSANLSGRPSSTTWQHVLEDFEGKIAGVIQGETSFGIESTVISLLKEENPQIVRPGVISQEEIEKCLGCEVPIYQPGVNEKPISPGTKYRHYAPKAPVFLFSSIEEALYHMIKSPIETSRLVLCNEKIPQEMNADVLPLQMHSFYAHLRLADQRGYEEIIVIYDSTVCLQDGFMNRIEKSAGI